jgi:hypothetical protein
MLHPKDFTKEEGILLREFFGWSIANLIIAELKP